MDSVRNRKREIFELDETHFFILLLELWVFCTVGWTTMYGCLMRGLVGRKEVIFTIHGVKLSCQTFLAGSTVRGLVLPSFSYDISTGRAEGDDEGLLNEIADHVRKEAKDEQLSQLDKNCADHLRGL